MVLNRKQIAYRPRLSEMSCSINGTKGNVRGIASLTLRDRARRYIIKRIIKVKICNNALRHGKNERIKHEEGNTGKNS